MENQTLIILDWDDTLFPTHWVMQNGLHLKQDISNKIYFENLDDILTYFLQKIQQMGKVIIITNALPEWIKASSLNLPKTYNMLNNIKVVSAREKYQRITNNMMDWKELALKMK